MQIELSMVGVYLRGKLILVYILVSAIGIAQSSLPVEMVYVEGGTFTMGCVPGRDDINGHNCGSDESPAHQVSLKDFLIGKYEVTQGQYEAIMGDNPSHFGPNGSGSSCGLDCPVEQVNWYAMIIFCNELTKMEGRPFERYYYRDAGMTEPWELTDYNPDMGGGVIRGCVLGCRKARLPATHRGRMGVCFQRRVSK